MRNQEYEEQVKFVKYLATLERQKKIVRFHAIINETSVRNPRYGAKLKAQGKRAGVPDLEIILHNKIIFIEMKRKRKVLKSGSLSKENLASEEQLKFMNDINSNCSVASVYIAYGFNEAKSIITREQKIQIKG